VLLNLDQSYCICSLPRFFYTGHRNCVLALTLRLITGHIRRPMSNRPSQSPQPSSPSSPPSASHRLEDSISTAIPSMIHVGRPSSIAPPTYSALASHYIPRSSSFIRSDKYSTPSLLHSSRHATPPDSMRASDSARGLKRGRSEELDDDEEERHESLSGSEASEHAEQPIMPAPKKRTRTLMTPDQLTALHRLLSQVSLRLNICIT
jgi:hypothetical protein